MRALEGGAIPPLPPASPLRVVAAQIAFAHGDVDGALDLLATLLDSPLHDVAVARRFRYATAFGRFREALLDLPARLSPANHAQVADALMRRDNPKAALAHLDPSQHMARADALAELGRWDEAAAELRQAGELDAAARLALRIGHFALAEELAQRTGAQDVLDELAAFRGVGHRALRGESELAEGHYDVAFDLLQSECEAAPGFLLSAHLLRLLARLKSGREIGDDAAWSEVADALAALKLPCDQSGLERAISMMQGNRTLAPSILRDGELVPLRFRPGPRFASRRLMNLIATAPEDEVLAEFAAVVAAHPESGLARSYRAELLLWLGRTREARDDLEHVRARFPQTRWAWIGLATVEMLEGRHERALEVLGEGIRLKGGTMGPPAYAVRGEILRRMGRLPEAIADLETACRLAPRRASAWINLALARPDDRGLAFLQKTLAPLLADASDLEHALALMQGNRSSSGVTWGRPLRYLFFDGNESVAVIQQRELELARAWLVARVS